MKARTRINQPFKGDEGRSKGNSSVGEREGSTTSYGAVSSSFSIAIMKATCSIGFSGGPAVNNKIIRVTSVVFGYAESVYL